jgi:hypothetical protein
MQATFNGIQGSKYQSSKEANSLPKCYSETTLKDNDLENMIKKKLLFIDVSEKDIEIIMKTLERDVEFL